MTTSPRTVGQIERDLEMLHVDMPVGEPPALEAPDGALAGYYRRMLARTQREECLWRELHDVLPHGTQMWAQLAVLQAATRAQDYGREVRGWIRENERKLAGTRV